jgi:drug/metabolite transporter (DMT)-like permease
MRRAELTGAAYGVAGMTAVGASVAFSSALTSYPIAAAQGLRYLAAAGLLLLWARWRRLPVLRPTRAEAVRLTLLAATGLAGFMACVVLALRYAEPAAVGVVIGATPLVLAVAAPLLAGRAPRAQVVAAAVVVVAGIALVEGGGRASMLGLLLAVGALTGEVAFTLLAAPLLPRLGTLGVSLHTCLLAVVLLVAAAPVEAALTGRPALPAPTGAQVASLVYLAVVVTAFAFLAWFTCVARLGAERAGLLVGVMPVSTLIASLVLGQASATVPAITGVALVGLGVGVGVAARARPRPPAREKPRATEPRAAELMPRELVGSEH